MDETRKMEVTQAMIEEWKAQHSEVYELAGELEEDGEYRELKVYVRKPKRADMSRLMKEAAKDSDKAYNNLIFSCLLHPEPDVLRNEITRKPGLIMVLGNELAQLIGSTVDFLAKRL